LALAIRDNEVDLTKLPSTVSPFIKDTIKMLLEKNPEQRPSAKTLVEKEEMQVYIQRIIS
jgi:serine/threonine protein kinase